jgi:GNAT superfamily N-acetyltransferase
VTEGVPHITEGYATGCIGRIAQLHAHHYAQSNGFGVAFEAKVASELSEFFLSYQVGRDGLWLVHDANGIQGSIAIDGQRGHSEGAHLRWFVMSDTLRGGGVGRQLLELALNFVDSCAYPSSYLWTFQGLSAARHLYESCGFRLVHEQAGSTWGTVVNEQKFVRSLRI